MTALEAIPKISELLARLIKLSKDTEAAALVQQIQEHQLVIQTALLDAERKMAQMERDHANAIAKLQAAQRTAVSEVPGDICPYCRRQTGQLVEIKDSPNPHYAFMGIKQRYFKCSNPSCGKNYDKEAPLED
jgi:TRAP-type mannitol/chloroaromatic compound transport system substrate-binding protein